MAEFIYTMNNAFKRHGDKTILENISISFYPGAKIGVVGPNGAGKSSVLKIMAGLDEPSNGEAFLTKGYSVGILEQEPMLDNSKTVKENIEIAVKDIIKKLERYDIISEQMAEPNANYDELMNEMGKLQDELDKENAWELDSKIEQAMDALRCPPADSKVDILSGGEKRRVALCKLLLDAPDLLLLDEPTNHLDAESVAWLEKHLTNYQGAILAVTHDRYFLNNVAQWILELDRGKAYTYKGNYSTYLEEKRNRLEVQGKKDIKLSKRLKEELQWVRQNAKGRQAKSKARLQRYDEMVNEANENRKVDFDEIQIPYGQRLGDVVIEANNIVKSFGHRTLFNGLSFSVPKNGIVGIVGPNGTGKTTLFKSIIGEEKLISGSLKIGSTVKISYVDQGRINIDPNKTVWEIVSDGLDFLTIGKQKIPSRAYIGTFGFKGADQQKPSNVLSGGERNRLNLALTLKIGGNLLLLDEPTNDLDVETLGSLENALLNFPGCVIVTSHDRWFLDKIATHILAWEGTEEDPSKWFWFEGNFQSYEENKIERLGEIAAKPHRVTYRKLTRE